MNKNYIEFENCKSGFTYKVDARNFKYAIFHNGVFHGVRHKFGNTFIDEEIHWDKDENHGTAKPQFEIEKTPDDIIEYIGKSDVFVIGYLYNIAEEDWPSLARYLIDF